MQKRYRICFVFTVLFRIKFKLKLLPMKSIFGMKISQIPMYIKKDAVMNLFQFVKKNVLRTKISTDEKIYHLLSINYIV